VDHKVRAWVPARTKKCARRSAGCSFYR
jgi:hypothetical protein